MADGLIYISLLASFSSCIYGCGLVVCVQDSSGKKIKLSTPSWLKLKQTKRHVISSWVTIIILYAWFGLNCYLKKVEKKIYITHYLKITQCLSTNIKLPKRIKMKRRLQERWSTPLNNKNSKEARSTLKNHFLMSASQTWPLGTCEIVETSIF